MSGTDEEIDLRSIPAGEGGARLLAAFDGLPSGGRLLLIAGGETGPLLQALQAGRAGAFDWNVLEAGPTRFRVEVARRRASGPRGVAECLTADHERLDGILEEVGKFVVGGTWEEAARRYEEFSCGLTRHIRMEEEVLFPAFERATGMDLGGPTEVMRQEHQSIQRTIEDGRRALRARDAGGYSSAMMALREDLRPHHVKEEHVLYPMVDSVAGGERGRDDLVRRMQAL